MAKPRVFVSSTYYDLKHIRSSLELFIESLGFEPVLSEKGDIAYAPDMPLDQSCYREAASADIFVLLVGGRYGSEASSEERKPTRSFFERYESITKREYDSAVERDIPVYILIEASVNSEYQTYLRNKDNKDIVYAHVDSLNIFRLIEEILARPRNNPTHTFERFGDIEAWLREQWSGLFRELLQRRSQQQQLATLTTQVAELREANNTLRRYLEALMTGITPADSDKLIRAEKERLEELEIRERIRTNKWTKHAVCGIDEAFDDYVAAMRQATSFQDFASLFAKKIGAPEVERGLMGVLATFKDARDDFNAVRSALGVPPLRWTDD